MTPDMLNEARFDDLSGEDKAFLLAFDAAMRAKGYTHGDAIVPGVCWGKYMAIYRKANVKNPKVYARVYFREDGLVLRLFLSGIEKHAAFLADAPEHIRAVFLGEAGDCRHCRGEHCKFQKAYALEGRLIEKCNGLTFEFPRPTCARLSDYLALFTEFYPPTKAEAARAAAQA